MIPPICELCGKDFRSRWVNTEQGGVLFKFADQRQVWFCDEHAEEALKHEGLSSDNALRLLREKYSLAPLNLPKDYGDIPDPQLWIINIGPSIAKVITIVKEATGLTTQKSMDLIKQRQAPAIEGPFILLQSYQERLHEIGVESAILFNDQEIPSLAPLAPSISVGAKEKERKNRIPEGGKSLPATCFLAILFLSIVVGYFFDIWWVVIILSSFLSIGIVSIVVRRKVKN